MVATVVEQKTEPVPKAQPPVAIVVEPRVVIDGVSWETYEALLADHDGRSAPRFAYDHGVLEIMSPRTPHEEDNRGLADIVTVVSAGLGLDVRNVGSTTFRRLELRRGFEADSAFYVQRLADVRERRELDAAVDPPPDLVIEADVTHSSLPKLPVYAAFGVPEVWRVEGGRVVIYLLEGHSYVERPESKSLPMLTSDRLRELLLERVQLGSAAWLAQTFAWAQTQAKEKPE